MRTPWGGGGDTPAYVLLAQNILSGKGYAYAGMPTALRAPGYPLMLAAFFKLFGAHALAAMRWLQFFEGIAVALLCAATAKKLFGEQAGKWTSGDRAFFPDAGADERRGSVGSAGNRVYSAVRLSAGQLLERARRGMAGFAGMRHWNGSAGAVQPGCAWIDRAGGSVPLRKRLEEMDGRSDCVRCFGADRVSLDGSELSCISWAGAFFNRKRTRCASRRTDAAGAGASGRFGNAARGGGLGAAGGRGDKRHRAAWNWRPSRNSTNSAGARLLRLPCTKDGGWFRWRCEK